MDGSAERPCYSVRLFGPFMRVLERYDELAPTLKTLAQQDPDDRIPIETVHDMLEAVAQVTNNPNLGLDAACATEFGDTGVADYLMSTVGTVRQSIEVLQRYRRLLNDAMDLDVSIEGNDAVVAIRNHMPLPRAATDFQIGGLFRSHFRTWIGDTASRSRVFIGHPAPGDRSAYERVFAPVPITFDAEHHGCAFPAERLDAPLERADSRLHDIVRKQAEQTLAQLPRAEILTRRIRNLLADELATGNPNALNIASQLGMSTRTLGRQLAKEGTTFSEVLDDLRRSLAIEYVSNRDLSFADVALLLGFSHAPAFHRAFRRWTGETPRDYRRAHGR